MFTITGKYIPVYYYFNIARLLNYHVACVENEGIFISGD